MDATILTSRNKFRRAAEEANNDTGGLGQQKYRIGRRRYWLESQKSRQF